MASRIFGTPIVLPGDPTASGQATNKNYVDTGLATKQPLDADLTTIAGLTATTDNMIQSVGSAWASRTPAQVRTALAVQATSEKNAASGYAPLDAATLLPTANMPLVLGTPVAATVTTTVTLDASAGSVRDLSCTTATLAFGVPTSAANRQVLRVSVRRSTSAALTVNLNGSIRLSTGLSTRALVVAAGEVLIMALENVATFTPTAVWVLTAATVSAT